MVNVVSKELHFDEELKGENHSLKNTLMYQKNFTKKALNYFKELWQKFIELLQDKFLSTNKYDDFINESYNEEILDENDLKFIENDKNTNKSNEFKR